MNAAVFYRYRHIGSVFRGLIPNRIINPEKFEYCALDAVLIEEGIGLTPFISYLKLALKVMRYAVRSAVLTFLFFATACHSTVVQNSKLAEFNDEPQVLHEIKRFDMTASVNAVAWNDDGTVLAALSNYGGTITTWSALSWQRITQFMRYAGGYSNNSFDFLSDGSLLTAAPGGDYSKDARYANTTLTDPKYSSLQIFSLIEWDWRTGQHKRYLPNLSYPPKDLSVKITDQFAVSAVTHRVAGIRPMRNIFIYDSLSGNLTQRIKIPMLNTSPHFASSLAFTPDGKTLVVGTSDGLAYFYAVDSGLLVRSIRIYSDSGNSLACDPISFSSDGKYMAVGRYRTGFNRFGPVIATVWNVNSGEQVASIVDFEQHTKLMDTPPTVRAFAWKPHTNVLAIGDDSGLSLWAIDNNGAHYIFNRNLPHTFDLRYSSKGSLAVVHENYISIFN